MCSLEERPGIGYVFIHLTFEGSGLGLRRKKHFAEFSRSTPRGRKFALLTILFLRAGALILEAVENSQLNSLTEHERKCFLEVEIK